MKTINFEVKSLLAIYSIIPQVAESIDSLVQTRACCSDVPTDVSGRQMDSIIKLMQQKVDLINLKLLTDEALASLPERFSKLIVARYIDKMDIQFLASAQNLSVRETYRKIARALKEFKRVFASKVGLHQSVWDTICGNVFWLGVMDRLNNFEDDICDAKVCPEVLCSLILHRLRKIV
jgi:hypothetical protein